MCLLHTAEFNEMIAFGYELCETQKGTKNVRQQAVLNINVKTISTETRHPLIPRTLKRKAISRGEHLYLAPIRPDSQAIHFPDGYPLHRSRWMDNKPAITL